MDNIFLPEDIRNAVVEVVERKLDSLQPSVQHIIDRLKLERIPDEVAKLIQSSLANMYVRSNNVISDQKREIADLKKNSLSEEQIQERRKEQLEMQALRGFASRTYHQLKDDVKDGVLTPEFFDPAAVMDEIMTIQAKFGHLPNMNKGDF